MDGDLVAFIMSEMGDEIQEMRANRDMGAKLHRAKRMREWLLENPESGSTASRAHADRDEINVKRRAAQPAEAKRKRRHWSAEQARAYRSEHREEINAKRRARYAADLEYAERMRERGLAYYAKHREEINAKRRRAKAAQEREEKANGQAADTR